TKFSDRTPATREARGRKAPAQKVRVRARAPALYGSCCRALYVSRFAATQSYAALAPRLNKHPGFTAAHGPCHLIPEPLALNNGSLENPKMMPIGSRRCNAPARLWPEPERCLG